MTLLENRALHQHRTQGFTFLLTKHLALSSYQPLYLADIKANTLWGYTNRPVTGHPVSECVKCSTLLCHFPQKKGEREFVLLRNLTPLILHVFV